MLRFVGVHTLEPNIKCLPLSTELKTFLASESDRRPKNNWVECPKHNRGGRSDGRVE